MLQIKSKYFDDLDTADLFFLWLYMNLYEGKLILSRFFVIKCLANGRLSLIEA